MRQRKRLLDLGVSLLGQRAVDCGKRIFVGVVLQLLGGSESGRTIGRGQLERGDGRRKLLAHPVVENDVVAIVGQRRDGFPGQEIGSGFTLYVQHLVLAHGLHFAIEKRLEQSHRPGVATRAERANRLDLGVALAKREITNRLGINRRGYRQSEKRGQCCEARVREPGDEASHRDSPPPWDTCG